MARCRAVLQNWPAVRYAWLFGSASHGRMTLTSDVDVGVFTAPGLGDTERTRLWLDLSQAVGREVDLLVLSSETNPALAADVVRGRPIKDDAAADRLELFLTVTSQAEAWERFILGFYRQRQESRRQQTMSGCKPPFLSPSQRDALVRRFEFCRQEARDLQAYRSLTYQQYQADRSARRNVDRIAETMAAAAIDMAKILLAASEGPIPQTYGQAMRALGHLGIIPQDLADRLAELATLRNALAHEYLDLKWPSVQRFIEGGHADVLKLIAHLERHVIPPETPHETS